MGVACQLLGLHSTLPCVLMNMTLSRRLVIGFWCISQKKTLERVKSYLIHGMDNWEERSWRYLMQSVLSWSWQNPSSPAMNLIVSFPISSRVLLVWYKICRAWTSHKMGWVNVRIIWTISWYETWQIPQRSHQMIQILWLSMQTLQL